MEIPDTLDTLLSSKASGGRACLWKSHLCGEVPGDGSVVTDLAFLEEGRTFSYGLPVGRTIK